MYVKKTELVQGLSPVGLYIRVMRTYTAAELGESLCWRTWVTGLVVRFGGLGLWLGLRGLGPDGGVSPRLWIGVCMGAQPWHGGASGAFAELRVPSNGGEAVTFLQVSVLQEFTLQVRERYRRGGE